MVAAIGQYKINSDSPNDSPFPTLIPQSKAAKQRCALPGTSSKCKWSTSSPGSNPSWRRGRRGEGKEGDEEGRRRRGVEREGGGEEKEDGR